jgi:integrase
MANLKSFLADQFHEYIEFRSSLGYSRKSLGERAATFDRFLYEQYPSHTRLSLEILHKWAETRQNEHPNGKRARLSITETFLKYLCETNYCYLHIPQEAIPRNEHFNPFILSDRNLEDLFHAADTIPISPLSPNREYVMPVMLRMMYCCALRPGEPFHLLRDDVDFGNGTIFIRQSKKHKDRTVWMSEDIFNICKEYDNIFGARPFFFTSPTRTMYAPSWLRSQFEICLKKAGLYDEYPRPRPYDLRHAAASRIILKWLGEGVSSVEMLYRLKVHLGHEQFQDTMWYLHALPNNLVNSTKIDWDSLDGVYSTLEEDKHEKN